MSIELRSGMWCGASFAPVEADAWASSPVYVTTVEPLKTGKNLLHLCFVAVFQPGGSVAHAADYRVLLRAETHLVLTPAQGSGQSLMLEVLSREWLAQHWPSFLERDFPAPIHWEGDAQSDLLSLAYFGDARVIERGVTAASFSCPKPPMPAQSVVLPFVRAYEGLDACLLRRGLLPQSMEDRWFVYLEGDQLLFRRSWTGLLIYSVRVAAGPGGLHSRSVVINRDPAQYGETNDADDLSLLDQLIDRLLLGKT